MRLLFWVQHLLGIGHVVRASAIVQALKAEGFEVTVAFGGMPVAEIEIEATVRQLTPVRATDQTFAELVTGDGLPARAVRDRRTAELLTIARDVRPDAILIEAWPFGRRAFSHELTALLDAHDVFAAISVRDILQTGRKPGRAEETRDLVNRHADLLLVHGDDAIAPLSATFPLADGLRVPVVHTGYVAPGRDALPTGDHDIVVSAGGGAFGLPLMRAAIEAARGAPDRRWLLATGPNLDAAALPAAPANVEIVPFLAMLRDHLAGARVSVSQAGYNTVMDVLRAQVHGTAAVLVPSDVTGQTEQASRARALEAAGRVACLPESELTPTRLLAAIDRAPAPGVTAVRFDGAARTASILKEYLS